MKNSALTSILMLMFGLMLSSQPIPPDSLYLGQTPPGNTPQIFAPGIISLPGRVEYGISISPDGKEMLFALGNWPDKRTMIIKYENNHWTSPDTVSFSTTRSAEEAIYSPGGQRVYYYAYNPPNPLGGADLCYSTKTGSVWGEPVNLGSPLNTSESEYHPCIVADSSIYFENSAGKICYSKFQNGSYQPRILLPALFNDPNMAWGNPYVSPDESYFIFNSSRPGGFGSTDLYISYKKTDGTWTNPKNLGNVINTPTGENGSEITDDNLYMTFVSNNDVYWVESGFIDSLKYTNFVPYVKNLIPDQTATKGELFNYSVPDSTFFDDDGNNTLSFYAQLANGNPLPDWLTFDSINVSFTGTPLILQLLNIKVTATDTAGASISDVFKLTVEAPVAIDLMDNLKEKINLYPNPTTGLVNISLNSFPGKEAVFRVCSIEGKTIIEQSFIDHINFDLSKEPKGIYICKLICEDKVFIYKICKK